MNQSALLDNAIISGIDTSACNLANLGEKDIDCLNTLMGLYFDTFLMKNARCLGALDQTKAPIELALASEALLVKILQNSTNPKGSSDFC